MRFFSIYNKNRGVSVPLSNFENYKQTLKYLNMYNKKCLLLKISG